MIHLGGQTVKFMKLKKSKLPKSGICIIDDQGSERYLAGILDRLNNENNGVKFEIVEEEKEMTKYAKITKYVGPHNIDKRLGLEIGKTYKIVEYKSPLTDNCYIYLNDEYPYYFISERQYELVEKEETPTFKTTIDLKSSVQAKIDSLTTEAEHLFKKRDRLEQQAINLSKKARKLNNLIESIKEFE